MSYDIRLTDPNSGATLHLDAPHELRGGTFAVGGTTELWLNVTYNYAKHFYRVLDPEKGIRSLYGRRAGDTIEQLTAAAAQLGDDVDPDDYWNPTEGNAKAALLDLLTMAWLRPDGVWEGD